MPTSAISPPMSALVIVPCTSSVGQVATPFHDTNNIDVATVIIVDHTVQKRERSSALHSSASRMDSVCWSTTTASSATSAWDFLAKPVDSDMLRVP
jgi:hypothetical protein